MAVKALAIIVRPVEPETDYTFRIHLQVFCAAGYAEILCPTYFGPEDPPAHINITLYHFVETHLAANGITLGSGDTIRILSPYYEASTRLALNAKFTAFLPLSEDTASHLRDTVGSFDLTNNNGVTFEAGEAGYGAAARFVAASSQSLTRAYDAALNPTDGLTFKCRIKFGLAFGTPGLGIGGTWTATTKGWSLIMTPDGDLTVYVAADGLDTGDNCGTTYLSTWDGDGFWHSIVVHIDPTGATNDDRLQITVDDVLQPLFFTGTIPAAIMDDGGAFTIGNWNGSFANGLIDECELQDVAGAPIARWGFEGGTRSDSIGENDFTEVGSVTREAVAGGGGAAVFDGGPDYLYIDNSADLASGDFDWTIPIWVKPGTFASDGPIFSSWYIDPTGAASRSVYELWWVLAGGFLELRVHDGVTLNLYDANTMFVPIDRWSLIVVMYDASTDTISVRVNQQAAESFILPAPILSDSNRFYIGTKCFLDYFFTGAIRRFGYAPHLFTDAEVLTLWNNGAGQDWPMEEAQAEGNTRYCRLGANHAISSTTKTNVPGMSFVLAANTIYSLDFTLFTTANAGTVGVQIGLLWSGDTGVGFLPCFNYQGPASASALKWLTGYPSCDFNPTVSQGNAPGTVKISGTIEVGDTGGTLQLTHGSSTASLTTVLAGSWGMCARHSG